MKNWIVLAMFSGLSMAFQAQTMRAEEAVAEALKNNFDIQMAGISRDIASSAATRGVAGQMPTVTLNGGATYQNSNIRQEFSNGLEVVRNGVNANVLNSSLNVSWMLFQGRRVYYTYNRLKQEAAGGEIVYRQAIEQTVFNVLTAYYRTVQIQQELRARKSALESAELQVSLARRRLEIGSGDRVQLLQTEIGRNRLQSAVIQQTLSLEQQKAELNRLMQRAPDSPIEVSETFDFNPELSWASLQEEADRENLSLLFSRNREGVQRNLLSERKSLRSPGLLFNGAYTLNRNQSDGGFALFNFGQGPSLGLALSWNLYDGKRLQQQIYSDRRLLEQQEVFTKQIQQNTRVQLWSAWRAYTTAKALLELEASNLRSASENLSLANERFRLGNSGILELKDAQLSLDQAISAEATAAFTLKQAELELQRLAGKLGR